MTVLTQTTTLNDSCMLIGKSKSIFAPVKEAVSNAFDSIVQRQQKTKESFSPNITITFNFEKNKTLFGTDSSKNNLRSISIEDNGMGFNSENLTNFKKFGSRQKGLNNRGTGKIQIFCWFGKIDIDSIFEENSEWYQLKASWIKKTGDYSDDPVRISPQTDRKTVVTISDFCGTEKEQEFYERYITNSEELRKDILKSFLLRLWQSSKYHGLTLEAKIFVDDTMTSSFKFDKQSIPTPDIKEEVTINAQKANVIKEVSKSDKEKIKIEWEPVGDGNTLSIYRFKIPAKDIDENGVYMCSKGIVVEQFNFSAIKRKNSNFDGFRYITSIQGDIFDDENNVSQQTDKFNFPSKTEVEKDIKEGKTSLFNQDHIYILEDEIKNKVNSGLEKIYADVKGLKEGRERDILALAQRYGIPPEDVEESNIAFNESEEEVTEKLFETQGKRFAKQNMEIYKTYDELKNLENKDLDPTSTEFRTKFGELSNKLLTTIPQQNKDELARYVIRRDMVVDLLNLSLSNELSVQKEWEEKKESGERVRRDKEGLIHDLIFKRRTKGVPNDLWILNEEFVHFDGYSDTELEKLTINGKNLLRNDIDIEAALASVGLSKKKYLDQRPDVFLFPEEGKCILVEFKAPDEDVTEHCDQIQKYARLIANYATKKFNSFFGFLIGETIDKVSIPGRYNKVPYGNYWFYPNEPVKSIDENETVLANLYQEIIPLSEIGNRAKLRNASFADKLGISEKVLNKVKEENITE